MREREPRKRISHGLAIYNRREKVRERERPDTLLKLNQQIFERLAVSTRLAEIGKILSSNHTPLSELNQEQAKTRVKLVFEEFWLQAKIGIVGPESQQHKYLTKLGDLQVMLPDTYTWFIARDEDGKSEAEKIRYAIMPPNVHIVQNRTRGVK
jgi:hypothetical protein